MEVLQNIKSHIFVKDSPFVIVSQTNDIIYGRQGFSTKSSCLAIDQITEQTYKIDVTTIGYQILKIQKYQSKIFMIMCKFDRLCINVRVCEITTNTLIEFNSHTIITIPHPEYKLVTDYVDQTKMVFVMPFYYGSRYHYQILDFDMETHMCSFNTLSTNFDNNYAITSAQELSDKKPTDPCSQKILNVITEINLKSLTPKKVKSLFHGKKELCDGDNVKQDNWCVIIGSLYLGYYDTDNKYKLKLIDNCVNTINRPDLILDNPHIYESNNYVIVRFDILPHEEVFVIYNKLITNEKQVAFINNGGWSIHVNDDFIFHTRNQLLSIYRRHENKIITQPTFVIPCNDFTYTKLNKLWIISGQTLKSYNLANHKYSPKHTLQTIYYRLSTHFNVLPRDMIGEISSYLTDEL